jgi:hypothetical protein
MKRLILGLLCAMLLLPLCLSAQDNTINLASLLTGTTLTQSDSLTNRIAGFAHANWSQGGIGLSYKHIVLMWNRTVLPVTENYKADVGTSVLSGLTEDQYDIYETYNNVLVGYMFRLGKNFYPYLGTGTALATEMIKVMDPDDGLDTYTIKGKEITYGSGIAGIILRYDKHILLEGSVQFKPLLPFIGVGIAF